MLLADVFLIYFPPHLNVLSRHPVQLRRGLRELVPQLDDLVAVEVAVALDLKGGGESKEI